MLHLIIHLIWAICKSLVVFFWIIVGLYWPPCISPKKANNNNYDNPVIIKGNPAWNQPAQLIWGILIYTNIWHIIRMYVWNDQYCSHGPYIDVISLSLQVALERAIVSMRLRFRVAFWVMRLLIQSVSPSTMLNFIWNCDLLVSFLNLNQFFWGWSDPMWISNQ